MRKLFTLPNLYVLLWALYYTQGTFLPKGSVWSRGVLVLYILISIYFLFVTIAKHKQSYYFKSLGILLFMFTIYGIIHIVAGGGFVYLQLIYLSLLPIYSFFVFSKKGQIDKQWMRTVFFVVMGVVVVQYVSNVRHLEETLQEAEKATINVGYEILALLPLLYFWKNKPIVQYVFWALALVLVVSTVKRGAIIIGTLCTVYFIYNSMKHSTRKTKWYIWLVVLAFVVVGVRYVINFYANSEYAQMRMLSTLEGDSSGRDSIYRQAWSIFLNSNLLGLLFGHGADATINTLRVYAHNDWLEILVNQGLLGVIVYSIYWINFYKTFKHDKNPETKPILGTLIIIYFLATLFSMSYNAMTLPATLVLGYCLAEQQKVIVQQ